MKTVFDDLAATLVSATLCVATVSMFIVVFATVTRVAAAKSDPLNDARAAGAAMQHAHRRRHSRRPGDRARARGLRHVAGGPGLKSRLESLFVSEDML